MTPTPAARCPFEAFHADTNDTPKKKRALLRRWERPDNYIGPNFPEYFVGLGRSRDSDTLENCNFDVLLERLGGEDDDAVLVVRDSHWAVGWVEQILVHQDFPEKLGILAKALADLENYPVLDDDAFSQAEMDEADETLKNFRDEFREEVLRALEFREPDRKFSRETARLAQLDAVVDAIFQEDIGWRGVADAYVSQDSIRRMAERLGRHELRQLAADGNLFARALLKVFN
jgi:hypothetical protein